MAGIRGYFPPHRHHRQPPRMRIYGDVPSAHDVDAEQKSGRKWQSRSMRIFTYLPFNKIPNELGSYTVAASLE